MGSRRKTFSVRQEKNAFASKKLRLSELLVLGDLFVCQRAFQVELVAAGRGIDI